MKTLSETIMEHVARLPKAAIIRAEDLSHLGSRTAINRALARLAKQEALLRVCRGVYVRLFESRFGKHASPVDLVVRNLAQITGETVAPHGAAVANGLGLTTQVPMRIIYITSGRSRMLKFRALKVELRHAPRWQIAMGTRKAGDALRAVAWIGPEHSAKALRKIKSSFSKQELQEMVAARPKQLPWLARQVAEIVA